jgi:eukaryotic-like serine/threonine-protein kinase
MAAPSSLASVGSVLARRWRLVQKLGEGTVGEVYSADGVGGGARVAVKLLRPELAANSAVAARFVEEGRDCARLIHPNIVRVLECERNAEGAPFVVMELLEGVPLSAYTRDGGRVPITQAIAILQGVLAGLAAAHAQGVMHRDLKPDNVFLMRRSGGTFVVKLLDFGMAGVMDVAGGMGSRAPSGVLLGTPAYMSPEQARSDADVDARADLFGAGAIFYEMLTGRVAFSAPTEYARLAAVRSTDPEPMDRIDPALAALGPFVARALQKPREARFPSALDMARALAAAAPSDAASPRDSVIDAMAPGTSPLSRLAQAPSVLATSAAPSDPVASLLAETAPAPWVGAEPPLTAGDLSGRDDPLDAEPSPRGASGAIGGTLPSQDLPRIVHVRARGPGVRAGIVAALVALGIAAGFVLGWVAAR